MPSSFGVTNQQSDPGQLHPVVEEVIPHTSGSSTTHNVVMPADIEAGDLLIILATYSTGTNFSTPSGWTEGYSSLLGGMRYATYGKIAAGTEDGTNVNVASDESTYMAAQAFRITSWSGDLANIDFELGEGSFSAETTNTSWGNFAVLWINVLHASMAGTYLSNPAGYSDYIGTETGAGTSHAQTYSCQLKNTAASDAGGTWIFSGASGDYSCFSIAIKGIAA